MTVMLSSQRVEVTHTVNFTTMVTGVESDSFTYQWRHKGMNISGKTEPALIITNVMESNNGEYDCIVNNGLGDSNTSNTVMLTVTGKLTAVYTNNLLFNSKQT